MPDAGYGKLDIYQMAHTYAVEVHKMTMKLPSFEHYEEGSQVRRSSKRISASIVEGYASRQYKAQFLNYLYRALGSSDETQEHLLFLKETHAGEIGLRCDALRTSYTSLSGKILRFIQGVQRQHETPHFTQAAALDRPTDSFEDSPVTVNLKSDIRNPKSGD